MDQQLFENAPRFFQVRGNINNRRRNENGGERERERDGAERANIIGGVPSQLQFNGPFDRLKSVWSASDAVGTMIKCQCGRLFALPPYHIVSILRLLRSPKWTLIILLSIIFNLLTSLRDNGDHRRPLPIPIELFWFHFLINLTYTFNILVAQDHKWQLLIILFFYNTSFVK